MFDYAETRKKLAEEYGSDFERASGTSFSLTNAEAKCIANWLHSLQAEILELQAPGLEELGVSNLFGSEPYYGAVGGGIKYSFTPTSLGTILTVKETITGKELNVSDSLSWYFYG